ncbi:UNVERIFIED_CONTAM: hypothetical protein PYX00_008850 [Menopon gallinae]|uniref:Uncharacterized protein n=1 Tax=Menopon gallinae TaxID=328185 RepID=A0AAW2H9N3_9NEOP
MPSFASRLGSARRTIDRLSCCITAPARPMRDAISSSVPPSLVNQTPRLKLEQTRYFY